MFPEALQVVEYLRLFGPDQVVLIEDLAQRVAIAASAGDLEDEVRVLIASISSVDASRNTNSGRGFSIQDL